MRIWINGTALCYLQMIRTKMVDDRADCRSMSCAARPAKLLSFDLNRFDQQMPCWARMMMLMSCELPSYRHFRPSMCSSSWVARMALCRDLTTTMLMSWKFSWKFWYHVDFVEFKLNLLELVLWAAEESLHIPWTRRWRSDRWKFRKNFERTSFKCQSIKFSPRSLSHFNVALEEVRSVVVDRLVQWIHRLRCSESRWRERCWRREELCSQRARRWRWTFSTFVLRFEHLIGFDLCRDSSVCRFFELLTQLRVGSVELAIVLNEFALLDHLKIDRVD